MRAWWCAHARVTIRAAGKAGPEDVARGQATGESIREEAGASLQQKQAIGHCLGQSLLSGSWFATFFWRLTLVGISPRRRTSVSLLVVKSAGFAGRLTQ